MSDKPRIAVILAGCGNLDGSEIHEAVTALLAIDRLGADYACFAPDITQHHVINHLTRQVETSESRNVLVESARIARGKITALDQLDIAEFDGIVLPGGMGATKNLSNFATEGPECSVHPQVERVIRETHAQRKPIGALCIAPALIARVLGGVTVTLGPEADPAHAIVQMGGQHEETGAGEAVIDVDNLVVTTPCYMIDSRISDIAKGAENTVMAMLKLMADPDGEIFGILMDDSDDGDDTDDENE